MIKKAAKRPTNLTVEQARKRLFRPKTIAKVREQLGRLGVPEEDLRDLAQAVMLAALESFHGYDPRISHPDRWVNRIAVHASAHYHARLATVRSCEYRGVFQSDPLGQDELVDALRLRRLVEANADLFRIVLEHDLNGVPMDEIVERDGRPCSTVYAARRQEMVLLRRMIEPRLTRVTA